MNPSILIGIDGGGTHSTAVAAWPDGRIAAVAEGGGLNFHNDGIPAVRARLMKMISRLQAASGAPMDSVCVGFSALDAPAEEHIIRAFAGDDLSPAQMDFQSDAYIALMGLTRGEPGVIVICGTGSMLLMSDTAGNQLVSGGWGYLLNDAGSGYTLAREAVLAAIDQFDGMGSDTVLAGDALSFFSAARPRALIDAIYAPGFSPDRLAAFARIVISRASEGDETALDILTRNMSRLARLTARLMDKDDKVRLVGLYGGIFEHSPLAKSLYSNALKAEKPDALIVSPEYPPELGAVIRLMKKKGLLDQQALDNLKNTYKEIRHEHA